jgi:predicted XRE-type DNA-binding protein
MLRKDSPQGTDNVLVDLGFDDTEELSAKTILAIKLNELIDDRGLNQTEVADITGMTQPSDTDAAARRGCADQRSHHLPCASVSE